MAKIREELNEDMKLCKYCGDTLLASPNEKVSEFGVYHKTNYGWYYQTNCKECQREAVKLKSSNKHTNTKQIKEHLREKRALEKANREWSIYNITIDLTSIEERLEKRFSRWHERYFYIGVTKREPQKRWNEHLYHLKKSNHCNEVMQAVHDKIREVYQELNDKEFQDVWENAILKFEVVKTLDNNMSEYEAHKHEAFEIKALDYELFYDIKENYKSARLNGHSEKDISYLKDDMIINVEHCSSTTRALNEHKKTTQSLDAESCS